MATRQRTRQKKSPASAAAAIPDAAWRRAFRSRLLHWYAQQARDLPWRRSANVYHIWVSEIMLQQTQVATVQPYYRRFLRAFPTIAALAAADEQAVLQAWEGLGYYRRARQLHAAARIIVQLHDGRFPRQADQVRALPGIGRYTAGAILSIAYGDREPILEANTVRLFARLLGFDGDPTGQAGRQLLWQFAEALLPRKDVGTFNQALMELGSLVCVPKAPNCSDCPALRLCRAAAEGRQQQIPAAPRRQRFESVREAAVVVRRRGRVLVRRCGPDERWAGLWDFPRVALDADEDPAVRKELIAKVRQLTGITTRPGERLTTIKHGVTRFRITLDCFDAQFVAAAQSNGKKLSEMKWLRPAELAAYPFSTTGRKIARLLATA